MAKRGTQPPYTSAADIDAFFERIRTMQPPPKIDTAWVESYGIAAKQPTGITAMLKWLGIVDDEGAAKPEIWNKIRQPSSRSEGLEPCVREGYSAVFDRVAVEQASREDLDGAFIDAYGVGDPQRKVGCFLTLCEQAGIPTVADAPSKPADDGARPKPDRTSAPKTTQTTKTAGKGSARPMTPPALTINLNVDVPSEWTEEQIRERIAAVTRAAASGGQGDS